MPVPKTSQNGQQSNETSEKKDGDEEDSDSDIGPMPTSVKRDSPAKSPQNEKSDDDDDDEDIGPVPTSSDSKSAPQEDASSSPSAPPSKKRTIHDLL